MTVPPVPRLWAGATAVAPRITRWIGDWYPLLLLPALYLELALLNRAVHGGRYFDAWVQDWEAALFGGQPSRDWAASLPLLYVSEILHAAYLAYYLIIYVPPLLLYLSGRRTEFRITVFTVMVTFFVHYLFFVYLPVQGPRYIFAAPVGGLEDGVVYQLAHRVLEAGSSRGAAFPSSHVGVAVTQTLMMRRYMPRFAVPLAVVTFGLALGAVYGGFHYAIDAIIGAALGAAIASIGPAAYHAIRRRWPPASV